MLLSRTRARTKNENEVDDIYNKNAGRRLAERNLVPGGGEWEGRDGDLPTRQHNDHKQDAVFRASSVGTRNTEG